MPAIVSVGRSMIKRTRLTIQTAPFPLPRSVSDARQRTHVSAGGTGAPQNTHWTREDITLLRVARRGNLNVPAGDPACNASIRRSLFFRQHHQELPRLRLQLAGSAAARRIADTPLQRVAFQ